MREPRSRKFGFLGPIGTHTEAALRSFYPSHEGVPFPSISAVFAALDTQAVDAGFVPVENILHGPVVETLDQLTAYRSRVCIAASHVAEIRHAVGVVRAHAPGTESAPPPPKSRQSIHRVLSHEQALGQCQNMLRELFPDAVAIPTKSTAAAIESVVAEQAADAAVVGSAPALLAAGFEILTEDASDSPGNKTRFVVLERGDAEDPARLATLISASDTPSSEPSAYITSIVVNPGRDREGLLFDILHVISVRHRVNLATIHSRPDTRGGVVFHLDLAGSLGEERIRACVGDLRQFALDSTGKTVEILVLGSYRAEPFYRLPFRSVGIIGHAGAMGRWFTRFFERAGLFVTGRDQQGGPTLAELSAQSDILLLSVPMSRAAKIAEELVPFLRPGQLVVENCSIKECVLPYLTEHAPEGVEVLGIHTMFGGSIETLHGENVIITRTERSRTLADALESLLYKHGARLQSVPQRDHDRISAGIQSLLQLLLLSYGEIMAETFGNASAIEFMSTPNYRNILQVLSRIAHQSDELITDLQTLNPETAALLTRCIQQLGRLQRSFEAGEVAPLLETVARARQFAGDA